MDAIIDDSIKPIAYSQIVKCLVQKIEKFDESHCYKIVTDFADGFMVLAFKDSELYNLVDSELSKKEAT